MDKDYYINSDITQSLHSENTMSTWNSLSSGQDLNCSSNQPMDCFMNLNWDKSTDQYNHFDLALSSMVSSSVATNSSTSNDKFALRELIGTLENSNNNNNTISPCFTTPLNSPPKLTMPIQNSVPSSPVLSSIPVVEQGFAERAAKFSCFGSRSFNGRTSQHGFNNTELSIRSNAPLGRLPRVSSSPSFNQGGSPLQNKNSSQLQMKIQPNNGFISGSDMNLSKLSGSVANSNEDSSVFEQVQNGESNSRKRKAVLKEKTKEDSPNQANDNAHSKRSRGNKEEYESEKEKVPEPQKDYIHVRARRGQATDSHSLAERVRREKIGERMKLLQDLVPGCNKVTGKALMLDEIINYVQAMQRQVEFLSMKLSSVNPRMEFEMSKEMFQPKTTFYSHQPHPFGEGVPQFHGLCEDDLQSIVQMGFNHDPEFHSQGFLG